MHHLAFGILVSPKFPKRFLYCWEFQNNPFATSEHNLSSSSKDFWCAYFKYKEKKKCKGRGDENKGLYRAECVSVYSEVILAVYKVLNLSAPKETRLFYPSYQRSGGSDVWLCFSAASLKVGMNRDALASPRAVIIYNQVFRFGVTY